MKNTSEQVDVIIQYPFPFDVTPQGQRFWELMEMYNPYAKIQEDPESPIVIFKMLRTHYEELCKTKALISEYEPIEEMPDMICISEYVCKVFELTIHIKFSWDGKGSEARVRQEMLYAILMNMGISSDSAFTVACVTTGDIEHLLEYDGSYKRSEFGEMFETPAVYYRDFTK